MNKLDEAKINLKRVLERLEKAVDSKLVHKKDSTAFEITKKVQGLQQELSVAQTALHDKKDEIEYLREQNSELQAKLGEEQHKNILMETTNRETAKRIDEVIVEVKSYLLEKNAS